jgi:chemotaxis protein CheD
MILAANSKTINISMGELMVSRDPSDILACIGLGSCIAVCIWDPVIRLGGVAHMLLPSSRHKNENLISPAKYIDTGVPHLINRMVKNGSTRNNMIVKITGGARMLNIPGEQNVLDIGQKNIAEIKAAMSREKLNIAAADLGGQSGRTLQLFIDSGRILVRNMSGKVAEL